MFLSSCNTFPSSTEYLNCSEFAADRLGFNIEVHGFAAFFDFCVDLYFIW